MHLHINVQLLLLGFTVRLPLCLTHYVKRHTTLMYVHYAQITLDDTEHWLHTRSWDIES